MTTRQQKDSIDVDILKGDVFAQCIDPSTHDHKCEEEACFAAAMHLVTFEAGRGIKSYCVEVYLCEICFCGLFARTE